MKIRFICIFLTLFCFLFITPCSFAGTLEQRVENSHDVINEIMRIPEKGIPLDLLKNCRAIAIFPNVLKGAFIFGPKGEKELFAPTIRKPGNGVPRPFLPLQEEAGAYKQGLNQLILCW